MITDILALFGAALAAALDWLEFFIDEVGATALVFGGFLMFTAVRLLLTPLLGGGMGSDHVTGDPAVDKEMKRKGR